MSEERDEKLQVQNSSLSTNEDLDIEESSDNGTVLGRAVVKQNSLSLDLRNQERDLRENVQRNFPSSIKNIHTTPKIPSLSKWVASNVQSITKFLKHSHSHESASPEVVVETGCKSISQSSTQFSKAFLEVPRANIKSTVNDEAEASTSQKCEDTASSHQINFTIVERSNVQGNPFYSRSDCSNVETNRPTSSRSAPINPQSPEVFISSQELTSKDPTDNLPANIIFGNIEAILNRALNITSQKERETTHSVTTLEPPRSGNELVVIGQAIPPEADSGLDVIISPPPYPPRVIQGPPSISGAPPSYSAVMRLGSEPMWGRTIAIRPSPPFIAPNPPPAYTQAVGYASHDRSYVSNGLEDAESYSDWIRYTLDQMVWGSDPITMICPRCANVIMTSTLARRSGLSHLSAVAMFFCGCWPCCLLPYCMDSCKNTYHYCPRCQAFLGVYRPW